MKSNTKNLLVILIVAFVSMVVSANAFYDPGLQRWINRDPLGDIASLPLDAGVISLSVNDDDGDAMMGEEDFSAWTAINQNLYGALGNNPINSVDYFGLAPGDSYPTCDAAGKDAIKDINRESIKNDVEYAGRIYKNPDGSYSYTPPNKGTKDSSKPGQVPDGKQHAGMYHTHGAKDPKYDGENFSDDDKKVADRHGDPSYLGTPSGKVKKYTPIPGKNGKVKTIGKGCK